MILLERLRDRGVGGACQGFGVLSAAAWHTERPRLPHAVRKAILRLRDTEGAGGAWWTSRQLRAVVDLGNVES